MAMQNDTSSSVVYMADSADGFEHGKQGGAAAKLGFYGTTPIAQPTAAAQAAVVDASGGAAAPTNGVLTLTATYNSAIIANALATIAAQANAMRSVLVNLGLMKGS